MDEFQLARFVSEGFDRAKAGDAWAVYNAVLPYFEQGKLPLKSHYAFGWVIYYTLHQQPDAEISARRKMLGNYLKLKVTKPHKLHSMILTEAIRLYKNAKNAAFNFKGKDAPHFSVVKFSLLWGLVNLRPGDWRRKEYEGKESTSTAEKLITVCVDELEDTRSSEVPAEIIAVVEKGLMEFPEAYTLMSQRAALHTLAGENEEAKKLLRKALLYAPGKFFLWSRLAMLYDVVGDARKRVGLLYKSLSSPGPEQFKGRVRLELAETLLAKGQPGLALWELERVKPIYEANDWHLPKKYTDLMERIPEGVSAQDPTGLYRKLEHFADEEVYDELPAIRVRKTYHKNPDAKGNGGYGKPAVAWRVTDEAGTNYWLQPHRFGLRADLPIGTILWIRVHNSRPVRASLAE